MGSSEVGDEEKRDQSEALIKADDKTNTFQPHPTEEARVTAKLGHSTEDLPSNIKNIISKDGETSK